jgi:hypothetical protein
MRSSFQSAVRALVVATALATVGLACSSAFAQQAAAAPPEIGRVAHAPAFRPPESDATPPPPSVARPVKRAKRSVRNAVAHCAQGRFGRAALSLYNARVWIARAHKAGMAQIGAPPTDPESDEAPGPPSVIAVFGMEHFVVMRVAPLYDGMDRFIGLKKTLYLTVTKRMRMLKRIVALDPEGAGGDYADGMADTLPIYDAEVARLTQILQTGRLTSGARTTLGVVLDWSQQTRAIANAAYGGGE